MRLLFALLVFLFYSSLSIAQYIEVQDDYTAQQLIQDVLIDSPCANVSNFSVSGWDQFPSYGYFSSGSSNFPFENGVILTTGRALSAIGPNSTLLSEGTSSWPGDLDLELAINEPNSINATVLEFDFLPLANKVIFEYLLSSEQYYAYSNPNQCNFSDGFAFLLREAGTQNQYQNLAVVPGTNIPVKITTIRGEGTICPAANPQFFDAYNGTEHPTNYNGQTKILRAEALVQPGTLYHLKLVVADQENPLYDSAIFLGGGSFTVENDLGPDRLLATGTALCFGEVLELDASFAGNNQYQWFRNGIAIPGETQPTFTVIQDGIYEVVVELENNTCTITGSITIEYAGEINLQDTTLIQCNEDESGIAVFNLFNASEQITAGDNSLQVTSFFTTLINAQNNTSPIPNPNAYTNTTPNQTVFARVMAPSGCTNIAQVTLKTVTNFLDPIELTECSFSNNPGKAAFDLNPVFNEIQSIYGNSLGVSFHVSLNQALQGVQALPFEFINTNPGFQTIYARLTNQADCFGILPLHLNVIPTPQFSGESEIFYCLDTFPEMIQLSSGVIGAPSDYNFLWSTCETSSNISINQPGVYSVEISFSENIQGQTYTCTTTRTINVIGSELAELSYVLDGNFGSQNIIVQATGSGDYVFALNNINGPYQDSNVFENLESGIYTVYVKDNNGCGIASKRIFIVGFPNYFTPNFDGINDYWQIEGINPRNNFVESVIVFDRHGKIIHRLDFNSNGWDGTYRGRPLPSSDYWFLATFVDGSTYSGHFTLKR